MSVPSYIDLLESYRQHNAAIRQLVSSILSSVASNQLLSDVDAQKAAIERLSEAYPFAELIYTLDTHGTQLHETVFSRTATYRPQRPMGKGSDRSSRPYFQLASHSDESIVVTEPYLSSATHQLSISAIFRVKDESGVLLGYVVLNFNLPSIVATVTGDRLRRRFQPFFRAVYAAIGVALLLVVGLLVFDAFRELWDVLFNNDMDNKVKPFGVVIFLTLGLAIFDLSKTILEEEVLMHKDIYRHVSTRRTITRFMTAILIAISIESLLLMFKSVLGEANHFDDAVSMMFAAVALLVGLGIYVFLGTRSELQTDGQ